MILVAIFIVISSTKSEAQTVQQIDAKPLNPETREQILQTSVQISMVEFVLEKVDDQAGEENHDEVWTKVEKSTSGLGTLVNFQGEIMLISHDHWSLFTSNTAPDLVTFRDANGSLLLEMSGADLLPLIYFHDSGTFILKAPEELADRVSVNAKIGYFETLNPRDIVHVVHRSSDQENHLSILAAEIIGQEIINGVSMLSLRSLNGESIEPGDSGGGIWINGQLAGNLWMTVRESQQYWWQVAPSDSNETAFSLAAGLRVELIDLIEILLQVESPPTLGTDGLS